MTFKHGSTTTSFLIACALFGAAACGGDGNESSGGNGDAGAKTADHCVALETTCNACWSSDLKQACLSSVISYKGGGATGQSACKAAIDAQTYQGGECAEPCGRLQLVCDACQSADAKQQCQGEVDAADSDACKATIDANLYGHLCAA